MKKTKSINLNLLLIFYIILLISSISCFSGKMELLFNEASATPFDYYLCDSRMCPDTKSTSVGKTIILDIPNLDPKAKDIKWRLTDAPGGATWYPSTKNAKIESFTPDSNGSYYINVSYSIKGVRCSCDFIIDVDLSDCNTSICPGSTPIFLGDSTTLDIKGVDPGASQIYWRIISSPGGATWNPPAQNAITETFTPAKLGTYNLQVSYVVDGYTCSCDFIVNVVPPCDENICPGSTTMTAGETTTLDIQGIDPAATQINWQVLSSPGGATWNPPEKNAITELFTPTSSGIFHIQVSYILYGLPCTCDFYVTVKSKPCDCNLCKPIAHDIKTYLEMDIKLPIRLQGTDPNRDPLTYNIKTNPQSGKLLGTAPELFYITNDVQFTGDDSFTYTVSDGTNTSAPAKVNIHVRRNKIESADLGGVLSNLVAHIPNHILYRELVSGLKITVDSNDDPTEHLLRRTDFTKKSMTLSLGSINLAPPYSISLKWIPDSNSANGTILKSSALSLVQVNGKVVTKVGSTNANHPTTPHMKSCNHVVISVTGSKVTTYVNGISAQISTVPSGHLKNSIKIGSFPGRIWDLRVFNTTASNSDVSLGSEDCTAVLKEPNFPEDDNPLPSYKCGVYMCLWYNKGDDITEDQVLNFLWHQDGFYENNALVIGMHPHGKIGASFKDGRPGWTGHGYKWRDIPLGERWIKYAQVAAPYDDGYWEHEDFHQYQGDFGQWSRGLAESTAEWSILEYDPDNMGLWITAEYTYDPHIPFWNPSDQTGYSTWRGEGGPPGSPENNGGFFYGLSVFQTFVTNEVLSPKYIGDVFNHQESAHATEAIYKILADYGVDMAEIFRDYSARVITFDYSHGEVLMANEISSFNIMQNTNPGLTIDSKFVAVYNSAGTGPNLQSPPSGKRPGSWAYNAYKVIGAKGNYNIAVVPGNNPDWAEFRATVVLYDLNTKARTYFPIDGPLEQGIKVKASGEELYLVVATTPSSRFEGREQYNYRYRITQN